jgi:hypothetical protein
VKTLRTALRCQRFIRRQNKHIPVLLFDYVGQSKRVLPDPVTPSSIDFLYRLVFNFFIASGWQPAGWKGKLSLNWFFGSFIIIDYTNKNTMKEPHGQGVTMLQPSHSGRGFRRTAPHSLLPQGGCIFSIFRIVRIKKSEAPNRWCL